MGHRREPSLPVDPSTSTSGKARRPCLSSMSPRGRFFDICRMALLICWLEVHSSLRGKRSVSGTEDKRGARDRHKKAVAADI